MRIHLTLAIVLQLASALNLSGTVYSAGNSTTPVNTLKAFLNGKLEARVNKKGYFFFEELPVGKYLLTIPSATHTFPSFEIEVFPNEMKAFQIDEKERFYMPAVLPLEIFDRGAKQYIEIKEPFNVQAFLKSPYGIMILATIGLVICMKNMPNMEELKNADQVPRPQGA